jgi:hypothetical protein
MLQSLPGQVVSLMPGFRHFGMQIKSERRRLFVSLAAAAAVASENSDDACDGDLCAALLELGVTYAMFQDGKFRS